MIDVDQIPLRSSLEAALVDALRRKAVREEEADAWRERGLHAPVETERMLCEFVPSVRAPIARFPVRDGGEEQARRLRPGAPPARGAQRLERGHDGRLTYSGFPVKMSSRDVACVFTSSGWMSIGAFEQRSTLGLIELEMAAEAAALPVETGASLAKAFAEGPR